MTDGTTHGEGSELSDLVAKAKKGDEAALNRLCTQCYDEILEFFRQRIPAHAEDLTQLLFAELPSKLEGYQESGRFRAWLRGVAYNMFLTKARSVKRLREETIRSGIAHPDPDTATLFRTAKGRLRALVTRLPDSLRRAWDLHAEGYSNAEIGVALGITEGAAATRVSRARSQLFAWLSGLADASADGPL